MDKVPPYKRPLNYADDKSLNANDKELVTNLDLSRTEFERYNSLAPFVKASIIQLLTERKRLNDYVKNYLQEKISEQFGQFMQLLWPTEHSLKYALQKVDESEDKINKHLESEGLQLFDKNTTMKNRLKILLATAYAYQDELDQQIAETFQSNQSRTAIAIQEKKSKKNQAIITELHTQIDCGEYFLHNKSVKRIQDPELSPFINKLKIIGIQGFSSRSPKYQPTLFGMSFISTLFEKIYPESKNSKDPDEDPSDNNQP